MREKIEDLKKRIGQKFGKLTFLEIKLVEPSTTKKPSYTFIFKCDCGVQREYSQSRARDIIRKDTISCGCASKAAFGKSYYIWKKDWTAKGYL